MTDRNDQQIIDDYIRLKTAEGWQIIARSESGVQLRKPKQVSRGLVVLGFLLLPFWGIGLAIWGLVLVDYLTQDEKIAFYTVDDIKSGVEFGEPEIKETEPISMIKIILITLIVMIIILASIFLISSLFV